MASFIFASCQSDAVLTQERSPTPSPAILEPVGTLIAAPTEPVTVTPENTRPPLLPSATPLPTLSICSPLEGYALDQMTSLVINPFHPPPPGSDDPHQGVDLADRQPGSQVALAGRGVQAVLAGSVAAVIQDRFPYGNALLVETSLRGFPQDLSSALGLSLPAPTAIPNLALTCPDVVHLDYQAGQSLYLLYAHLLGAPEFKLGDLLACGQSIGFIGASGNALNPHLHLEARLGPAGARFSSMAHYDNTATLEEMDQYCTWRVSGDFQLIDPLRLLEYAQP